MNDHKSSVYDKVYSSVASPFTELGYKLAEILSEVHACAHLSVSAQLMNKALYVNVRALCESIPFTCTSWPSP